MGDVGGGFAGRAPAGENRHPPPSVNALPPTVLPLDGRKVQALRGFAKQQKRWRRVGIGRRSRVCPRGHRVSPLGSARLGGELRQSREASRKVRRPSRPSASLLRQKLMHQGVQLR